MDVERYQLKDAEQWITPCLLVYPRQIEANIAAAIRRVGSSDRLRPHVKTHKTPKIVEMNLAAGIEHFKCATLSEAHMLGNCGAPDVLIAYPQVGPAVTRLIGMLSEFPRTRFSTVVDNPKTLQQLNAAAGQTEQKLTVYVDVDTGMHRTGIAVGPAARELYAELCRCPNLQAGGLHVYDGQNHQSPLTERQAAVRQLWQPVVDMVQQLHAQGLNVPNLVCGGTPTFPVFAELNAGPLATRLQCSPGTCVLSDFNYGRDYPDMAEFQPAAVLMTRVISRQHPHRVTVDLGYKAVASDPPAGRRCHFLNLPDAREIQHSEEHLVVESPAADNLEVGDVLYALPAHVCPTVALYSHLMAVVDGTVIDRWPVVARDRVV